MILQTANLPSCSCHESIMRNREQSNLYPHIRQVIITFQWMGVGHEQSDRDNSVDTETVRVNEPTQVNENT
ncbi:unnamed protein product, partial [Brassica oleracea]